MSDHFWTLCIKGLMAAILVLEFSHEFSVKNLVQS